MPKAKPDQVIVHRIELQETERATLEAALAGRFVTNAVSGAGAVLSGIGSALAPFSGAISALTAVWIADRTWDDLKEKVLDPIIDVLQAPVLEKYAGDYQMITAWLNAQYSSQGWGFLQTDNSSHEAYMNSAQGVSLLWRGRYAHPTLGELPVGSYQWVGQHYVEGRGYVMPDWLVDRFDAFIYTMKQPTATAKETKKPATWWVQFYPYAEFENEIIWYAKNR